MSDALPDAALPEGFPLEALLAPMAGESPAGVDLRLDFSPQSIWFRMRDARSEAREAERRAESEGEGADAALPAPWRNVHALATTALMEHTKDLEIAAWLTEALVRMHGLPGLTAGGLLLRGLAESQWDTVFPLPDEDGPETRLAPMSGLSGREVDGTLMAPLRRMALFPRPDGSAFAWYAWERSRELATITEAARRDQRIKAGTIPLEDAQNEARAAGSAHFGRLRDRLDEAIAAWEALGAAMDRLAPPDGISTGRVLTVLREMAEMVNGLAPPRAVASPEEAEATEDAGPADAAGGASPRPAARSREDHLRDLNAIAEHFRRTEPNSPLSYTLDEAVRRARLSWPELLAELVPEEGTRSAILNSLGIKPGGA